MNTTPPRNGRSVPVRTVREQIARQLRADILSGALPRGTKLRELDLAEQFGVSRGPIRDVLRMLNQYGLVVSEPNCGSRVCDAPSEWMQPLVIKVRKEIEITSLKHSIEHFQEEDFWKLQAVIDEMEDACRRGDMSIIGELDFQFHEALLESNEESELLDIWRPLMTRMILHYARLVEVEQIHAEHVEIFEAVKERNLERAIAALEKNIQ